MTEDDRIFERRLAMLLGFVRYIRDPDYHGDVIITRPNGVTIAKRENCSNENIRLVEEAVSHLRKMGRQHQDTATDSKIIAYTGHQIQFIGQCLLDRLYAKHENMKMFNQKGYSWANVGTNKQKELVSRMIRHEKVLVNTFRVFLQVLRLRSTTSARIRRANVEDAMQVVRSLRKMILWNGFSYSQAALQRAELPLIWNRVSGHYIRLENSRRWGQLVQALNNAEVNTGRSESFLLAIHRTRMMDLLRRSTVGI